MHEPMTSADAYGRLIVAATFASGILEQLGGAVSPVGRSDDPKLAADVFRQLLDCVDQVSDTGSKAGTGMLTISARRNEPVDVMPGHACDIARFLVADLALLSRSLSAAPAAVDLGPAPKHIFPSHTYALATSMWSRGPARQAVLTPAAVSTPGIPRRSGAGARRQSHSLTLFHLCRSRRSA